MRKSLSRRTVERVDNGGELNAIEDSQTHESSECRGRCKAWDGLPVLGHQASLVAHGCSRLVVWISV
jgi:hypothetical protein